MCQIMLRNATIYQFKLLLLDVRNCYPPKSRYAVCTRRMMGDSNDKKLKKRKYTVEQAYQKLNEPCPIIRPYSSGEDAIECQILLNLRPEFQKGTHIRGNFHLPHGMGSKSYVVAAWTSDAVTAHAALKAGARYAGTDLGERLASKTLHVSAFQRLLVSRTVASACTGRNEHDSGKRTELANIIHRHQLIPTEKECTLVNDQDMPDMVYKHVHGHYIPYLIKDGTLSAKLGKVSTHDHVQIAENLDSILRSLYKLRPEIWIGRGRGIQTKHRDKFIIKVLLSRPRRKKSFPLTLRKILTGIDDLGLYKEVIKRTILTL